MLAHTPSVAQGFGVLSNRLISAGSVTRLDFGVMRNSAQGSTLSRTNRQPNEDAVHRSHPSCEQTSSLAADEIRIRQRCLLCTYYHTEAETIPESYIHIDP